MKITAIRNVGHSCNATTLKPKRYERIETPRTALQADTVCFKGGQTLLGAGAGALLGLAALTILSGGAAAPLAYGVFAAVNGAAGGMLGKASENSDKEARA